MKEASRVTDDGADATDTPSDLESAANSSTSMSSRVMIAKALVRSLWALIIMLFGMNMAV